MSPIAYKLFVLTHSPDTMWHGRDHQGDHYWVHELRALAVRILAGAY